jgi:hypothetical protein
MTNTDAFERGLEHLVAYRAEHGHAVVPARYISPDGYRLGQWAWWLRSLARRGALVHSRASALAALGFAWQPRRTAAESALLEVVRAAHAPGWPANLDEHARRTLRDARAGGHLSAADTAVLDALRFPWDIRDSHWSRKADLVAEHLCDTGRLPVRSAVRDGERIGLWANRQRAALRAGTIRADRREWLGRLGMTK